jgi:ABC-2 type transport system permease protein
VIAGRAAGPRALLGLYRAQFAVQLAAQMQYRVMLVIWLIGLVLQPLMYLVVWATVARSQGGEAGGFTAGGFAAYFLVLMIVNQLTFTWVTEVTEFRVREGEFSPLLLRPVHPIHADLAENLTYKLLTLTLVFPIALLLGVSFGAELSPPGWAVAAFVPALGLAVALRFVADWLVALLAFWVTRMTGINQTYYVLTIFLTGQVAPLSLFPGPVRVVAAVLPFRWMVAFPVELLLGRLTAGEALVGFGAQAVWLAVLVAVLPRAWRAGVRRYSAVGA